MANLRRAIKIQKTAFAANLWQGELSALSRIRTNYHIHKPYNELSHLATSLQHLWFSRKMAFTYIMANIAINYGNLRAKSAVAVNGFHVSFYGAP